MAFGLFAIGMGLQAAGQFKANQDQARAERQNALWMREQAQFMREAGQREESIFRRQMGEVISTQRAGFAANGLEISGDVLNFIDATYEQGKQELAAMRAQTDHNIRGALLGAEAREQTARGLENFMNNAFSFGGTALTGYSQYR